MNKQIENIIKKEKLDSEIALFWNKMSDYLPKSFERSALGDEKIFTALKQAYIEFRPLISDEVLKVVVETTKKELEEQINYIKNTSEGTQDWYEGIRVIKSLVLNYLSNLSPNKENKNNG